MLSDGKVRAALHHDAHLATYTLTCCEAASSVGGAARRSTVG